MTVKILGAVLLVLSGAWLGLSKAIRMKKRLRFLTAMDSALALMAGEIALMDRALPELFEMLAQRGPGETRDFFRLLLLKCGSSTAGEAWEKALEFLELEGDEKAALGALTAVLGRYESQRQSAEIEAVRRSLKACADGLALEIEHRGKSYPALGMCAAGIAAMLLI